MRTSGVGLPQNLSKKNFSISQNASHPRIHFLELFFKKHSKRSFTLNHFSNFSATPIIFNKNICQKVVHTNMGENNSTVYLFWGIRICSKVVSTQLSKNYAMYSSFFGGKWREITQKIRFVFVFNSRLAEGFFCWWNWECWRVSCGCPNFHPCSHAPFQLGTADAVFL